MRKGDKDMQITLHQGIEPFTICYQPIIDLKSDTIYGYEALIRPKACKPVDLINKATKQGRLLELELSICSIVAKQFSRKNDGSVAFINLTPYSFTYNDGEEIMKALSPFDPASIVIEVTEAIILSKDISGVAKVWHDKGYRLAVDDISQGYSRLSAVAELMPDFIKIDRPCITGAVKSKSWRKVLESIINMARNIGAKTIGEGIETEKEKELVTEYGVDFAQGYYFGIPSLRLLTKQEFNLSSNKNCDLSRNVL
mgnify:FL=1